MHWIFLYNKATIPLPSFVAIRHSVPCSWPLSFPKSIVLSETGRRTQFPVPKEPAELLWSSCAVPISFVLSFHLWHILIKVTGAHGIWWLTGDFLWRFCVCCPGTGGEGLPVWVSRELLLERGGKTVTSWEWWAKEPAGVQSGAHQWEWSRQGQGKGRG